MGMRPFSYGGEEGEEEEKPTSYLKSERITISGEKGGA